MVRHSQAQNVFRSTVNLFTYLTDFSTDWLSDAFRPITTRAMGSILHCSTSLHPKMCLFTNRCSSSTRIMALPKLTFVLLCSWFLSLLPHRWRFMVAPLHGFVEDLAIALIVEVFNLLSFSLKRSLKCWTTLKTKHNHFNCDQSILGARAVTSK